MPPRSWKKKRKQSRPHYQLQENRGHVCFKTRVQHQHHSYSLENVQNFNSLGSTISRSGDLSPEVNNRLGRAASTFNNLLSIMRQKSIRLSTKLAIHRAAVITTLLYGAEAWNTTVAEEKRLAAFHTRCLRRILGVLV